MGFLSSDWGAVTCFLLGMSRMPFATFMILSTLGRMPATYVLALQGARFHGQGYLAAGLMVAAFGAVLLATYLCRDRLFMWLQAKAGRSLSE